MHAHTHMLVRMHAGTYPLPFAPFTTHRHTHAQTCMLEHAYYKKCLSSKLEGEERQKELSACHERGAERLLQLCFANGGVYTKLGQHIGQLDHLLPGEHVLAVKAQTPHMACTFHAMYKMFHRACHAQDHLLPEEYVLTMRNNLLDRCPISSYKEVSKIVQK
eukprot:285892-Pelagomonas_calceolata.AAC.1